jgi:3-methylcrotonyl-CoA carboxylase alpha subunit
MSSTLVINGKAIELEVTERKGQSVRFTFNGKQYHFIGQRLSDGSFVLEQEIAPDVWQRTGGFGFAAGKAGYKLQLGMLEVAVSEQRAHASGGSAESRLAPVAPMPGMVRQVMVKAGEMVTEGQPLVVLEAMKLQLTLSAGGDAQVEAVLVQVGQMVGEGAELVKLVQPVSEAA